MNKVEFVNELRNILNETVEYYSENIQKRAVSSWRTASCSYVAPNGNTCAVSRLLSNKGRIKAHEAYEGESAEAIPTTFFQKKYIKLFKFNENVMYNFLCQLQTLHDTNCYWQNEIGLTKDGEDMVEEINSYLNNLSNV